MSVDHKTSGVRGQPRATITCDDCGRKEVVACEIGNDGQARHKAAQMLGWTFVKHKDRCKTCEAKRKVVKMEPKKTTPEAPKQPSREQRREIMAMLDDCYDKTAERYLGTDNDDTVADVLGVMPGWVAEIREDFFGPVGSNEEIENLMADLMEWRGKATETLKASVDAGEQLRKVMAEASAFNARLDRINSALSQRIIKKAKA